MDPSLSPPPAQPPQEPVETFGSSQGMITSSRYSRKRILTSISVAVLLLFITGAGVSLWAIQYHNNQLAAQAKLKAAQQAKAEAEAKARQGTVTELETVLNTEFKQTQELVDRSAFSLNDQLGQEATAAMTIGTGNESGL